ncbi:unnamed protein product [Arabidopsis lyrata]|nr:unnamed protein product [Arabidopsis lyrata]
MTASTMVMRRFVWIYASVQFALVVLFAHIFYSVNKNFEKARATAEPGSDAAPTAGSNLLSASFECLIEPRSGKKILHLYSSLVNVV